MLGFIYFDPAYFIIVAPGLLLAMWATFRVKSTFATASKIPSARGWTGQRIAQAILDAEGIHDVRIEPTQGHLSDHYDPREKVLRLSPDVYSGRSLAAAGVAAHEVGHAIQHAHGYAPLTIRNAAVPVAGIGANFGMILLMIGIGAGLGMVALVGLALFSAVVFFQVVNLPVEFNASARARQALVAYGIVDHTEDREIARVLNAAALTYVAATITAILQLIYFLWRAGLLGGRRSD